MVQGVEAGMAGVVKENCLNKMEIWESRCWPAYQLTVHAKWNAGLMLTLLRESMWFRGQNGNQGGIDRDDGTVCLRSCHGDERHRDA